MVTKWLHLEELGGNPWILGIWTAVNGPISVGKAPPLTKELSELGVHVSTRLNILPRIITRLNRETAELLELAKAHQAKHVFTEGSEGIALRVDNDLKYQLIADIDSFLFEVNACAELMQRLFQLLRAHAGQPVADEKLTTELRSVLEKHGVNADWFRILDRNRNFVAHQGTPYLAIDITNDGAYELLIMKENLAKFDEPTKFFRYAELPAIGRGFSGAKAALRQYLVELFK